MPRKRLIIASSIAILGFAGWYVYRILFPVGPVIDDVPNPISDKSTISKIANEKIATNELKNVYFGDLHVHTGLSFDAFIGGTVSTPDQAYQFAKGQPIEIFGKTVKITQPLDFAAVTDHAEFIGELYSVQHQDAPGHYAMMARYFRSVPSDTTKSRKLFNRIRIRDPKKPRTHLSFFKGFKTTKSAWSKHLEAAEKHYQPGQFTTLAAYEWTLSTNMAHLHRNIFFRDMTVPDYPISALEARTPEQLWAALTKMAEQGATVMAVPHNSNLSKGMMFADAMSDGQPFNKQYAETRQKWEPLVEMHQAKGNSEVHAAFWKNDEFADFENYDYGFPSENNYIRYALKKGLEYEAKLGINPYKFGLIGSTDTHNATPGNTEENDEYIGNHTQVDLEAHERKTGDWVLTGSRDITPHKVYAALNPGGLVAVWAEANTRGHIYDALKRKETYATSGGRIQVRFFGGYEFEKNYKNHESMVKAGYKKGVPMGGELSTSTGKTAPTFIVWAAKDASSANLDRIQVIKGWYQNGQLQEKIYNVALSDNRKVNADGSVPNNGATVNMKTGAWSADKGAVELQTTWKDPDFDPTIPAFYYIRVLELPTASWRLWDQIRYGSTFPEGTKLTIRERAWSSPIWYSPSEKTSN